MKYRYHIEPQWTPMEMAERDKNATRYSRRVSRGRSCLTALVQRLLVGSYLIFSWACILALLVGAR